MDNLSQTAQGEIRYVQEKQFTSEKEVLEQILIKVIQLADLLEDIRFRLENPR